MRIKKKASLKVLALHVLIEQKSESVRAHCLDFDLMVTGKNSEQAMVRMEKAVKIHLDYAQEEKSNPVHFANQSDLDKWFDRRPSPIKKSWILELHFAAPKQGARKGSRPSAPTFKRYEQTFEQLACA